MNKAELSEEKDFIKNSKSMQKMQEITDRLVSNTPNLAKHISPDNLLKPQTSFGQQQQLIPTTNIKEVMSQNKSYAGKKQSVQQKKQINEDQMSVIDWQMKCKEIQANYEKEKEQNQILIQDINIRQERFIKRELEYRNIIQELQNELKSKTVLKVDDKEKFASINQLHEKVNLEYQIQQILIQQCYLTLCLIEEYLIFLQHQCNFGQKVALKLKKQQLKL